LFSFDLLLNFHCLNRPPILGPSLEGAQEFNAWQTGIESLLDRRAIELIMVETGVMGQEELDAAVIVASLITSIIPAAQEQDDIFL